MSRCRQIEGEIVALAIDPAYAPALLTVSTHEYILGRVDEAMVLLLSLAGLPEEIEDLPVIIEKAGMFLLEANDLDNAGKLLHAAVGKFPHLLPHK